MTSKEVKTHIIDTLNGDMNKEYFINELLPEILQDLERLEEFEKVLNGHCSKCVNRENNICVGMDAPIHIDTLINCIETENKELKKVIKNAIELLSIDGKGTKQQVIKLLKEVL